MFARLLAVLLGRTPLGWLQLAHHPLRFGMAIGGSISRGLLINGAWDDFTDDAEADDETKDTIEDVIAYLGLSDADIQFLERYYRLTGGMRPFSLISDRRKFMALCQRTPGFTVDMRDFAELAAPASPDARYADPETLDELLYLDPGTLVPLNATYEFVLGKGHRDAGRRALNELELGADIRVREDGIHIAIRDFVDFIDTEPDDTPPRRPTRWLPRLRNIMRR